MKSWYYLFILLMVPFLVAWSHDWADDTVAGSTNTLRVCADPNNLPFSNYAGQGFENQLAGLLAHTLGKQVEYTWWAQRRGFLRSTLNAGRCDVVMGLPSAMPQALTTQPYYRTSYVLVSRADRDYNIRSLDDPKLKHLRIGVHLIGNNSPPPALALAQRGITNNVVGYSIYGDYRQANPPSQLVEAVAHGDIDIAVVWGPFAGYFAKYQSMPLTITTLANSKADELPFQFSISLGVRPGDEVMRNLLDLALQSNQKQIQALLASYSVPQVVAGK